MRQFLTLKDLPNLDDAVTESIELKKNPFQFETLGKKKTLGIDRKSVV
jgi:N-succinyl-L-ornithine transcarbamylase